MSNLSLEENQLKITIKQIILDIFSETEEEFTNLLAKKVIQKALKKKVQEE